MWEFNDIWQYSWFTHTLWHLSTASTYYSWIVSTIDPTIDFMYDNFLTNPYFIGIVLTLLVLSLFTFSKS